MTQSYPLYYVQRLGHHTPTGYVVRQRSGREPLPGSQDPIIRAFDEADDAHTYAAVLNTTQERIQQQQQQAR